MPRLKTKHVNPLIEKALVATSTSEELSWPDTTPFLIRITAKLDLPKLTKMILKTTLWMTTLDGS